MRKEILLPIFKFWVLFVIFPLIVGLCFGFFGISPLATFVYDYIIFFSPVFFFLFPFRKIKNKVENRFMFIVLFFVIPYLFIYSLFVFAAYKALQNFGF